MTHQESQTILDPNMPINTLLDHYPESADVFIGLGMACIGCVFSRFHSLADAAVVYHLDAGHILHTLSSKLADLPQTPAEARRPQE